MSRLHRATRWRSLFLALTALGAIPLARAQQEAPPSVDVDYAYDTGDVSNTGAAPAVVASFVVQVHGATWLRLQFGRVTLSGNALAGTGSLLRITSIQDGAVQEMNAIGAEQWRHASAYFNGDGVLVEVISHPGTGTNRIEVVRATIGLNPTPEESQCGPLDDRVPSSDPRVGRILPSGCTGWLIDDCGHCLLTAGHCSGGTNTVQFNVPPSLPSGSIQHPPPSQQYSVDQTSKQTNGGQGIGSDWAHFGCFPNSTSGLTPFAAQATAFQLNPPPAFNSAESIRVTGFGSDSGTANQTQQTHVGPWTPASGTTVQYQVDTEGGNSGSPVIHEPTGWAIGIHTHGGCGTDGSGTNSGTGANHAGLQAAIANPRGVCVTFRPVEPLPEVIAAGFPTDVTVQYAEPIVPGSATLHYRYDGGAFLTVPLAALGGGLYRGTLPPPSCSAAPQFFFSLDSVGCGILVSPAGAPTSFYEAFVGEELVFFADNFQTDQGWVVTNDATLTSGAWQRAVPLPGSLEDPPSDSDGSGRCYVTQNANGNFDVDGGTTTLTSPVLDLSGGALVHYDYWLGSSGAIGAGDGLRVEIANDAAGTNWQLLRTYTVPTAFWRSDTIEVGVEIAATNTMRIRFRCTDAGGGHIVEGGVDAVRAVQVHCDSAGFGYCFGDGSATACPCTSGATGHGCENSYTTGGGQLAATGNASVSSDSVLLSVSGLPTVTGAGFFQGDQQANGGAGAVFGDGLLCLDGTLIRLGSRLVSNGEVAFGFGIAGDPVISVKGAVPASGATRFYQVYYRDSGAFCTSDAYNLTNGVTIVWTP